MEHSEAERTSRLGEVFDTNAAAGARGQWHYGHGGGGSYDASFKVDGKQYRLTADLFPHRSEEGDPRGYSLSIDFVYEQAHDGGRAGYTHSIKSTNFHTPFRVLAAVGQGVLRALQSAPDGPIYALSYHATTDSRDRAYDFLIQRIADRIGRRVRRVETLGRFRPTYLLDPPFETSEESQPEPEAAVAESEIVEALDTFVPRDSRSLQLASGNYTSEFVVEGSGYKVYGSAENYDREALSAQIDQLRNLGPEEKKEIEDILDHQDVKQFSVVSCAFEVAMDGDREGGLDWSYDLAGLGSSNALTVMGTVADVVVEVAEAQTTPLLVLTFSGYSGSAGRGNQSARRLVLYKSVARAVAKRYGSTVRAVGWGSQVGLFITPPIGGNNQRSPGRPSRNFFQGRLDAELYPNFSGAAPPEDEDEEDEPEPEEEPEPEPEDDEEDDEESEDDEEEDDPLENKGSRTPYHSVYGYARQRGSFRSLVDSVRRLERGLSYLVVRVPRTDRSHDDGERRRYASYLRGDSYPINTELFAGRRAGGAEDLYDPAAAEARPWTACLFYTDVYSGTKYTSNNYVAMLGYRLRPGSNVLVVLRERIENQGDIALDAYADRAFRLGRTPPVNANENAETVDNWHASIHGEDHERSNPRDFLPHVRQSGYDAVLAVRSEDPDGSSSPFEAIILNQDAIVETKEMTSDEDYQIEQPANAGARQGTLFDNPPPDDKYGESLKNIETDAEHGYWGQQAAGLLLRDGGRTLLVRRSPHVREGGSWGVPGGALDSFEDAYRGALREAKEELGSVPPHEVVDVLDFEDRGFRHRTFVCEVDEGTSESWHPRLNWENTEARWVTPSELAALNLHPGLAKVLRKNENHAKLDGKEPWELTQQDFLDKSITGHISSTAYERYATSAGLDWIKYDKHPKLVYRGEFNRQTVEFKSSGEKLKYTKMDPSDPLEITHLRDEHGNLVWMSDEEIAAENLPTEDREIAAFVDKVPIGFASDEWGVPGVWVVRDWQRKGIGMKLLELFSRERPIKKLGQATIQGREFSAGYHKRLVKQALATGKNVPPEVLADYPDLKGAVAERHGGSDQDRGLWYHGTARKNLRSILSQGLIPDPKRRAWDKDPNASEISPDRASYGGIYLTKNLMTALSSANPLYGDRSDPLLAIVDAQSRSLVADEDSVSRSLAQIGWEGFTTNHTPTLAYLYAKSVKSPDDSELVKLRDDWSKSQTRLIALLYKLEDPRLLARLFELCQATFLPSIARIVAYYALREGSWYRDYASKAGYSLKEVPPAPQPREAEATYRAAVDKITRTLKDIPRKDAESGGFNVVGRVMTPIRFKGANRIVALVELVNWMQMEDRELIVHYGKLPESFFTDYKKSVGEVPPVREA